MSDYMFMLDSHLRPEQQRALHAVQEAAACLGDSLFLTGGAIRDILGGFPVRDLDFTVESDALKLVKVLTDSQQAVLLSSDQNLRKAELLFPGRVTVEISMARTEKFPKPGGKPQVTPTTIHEDMRRRDFTINAMALSMNRASRGLLIDPVNGRSDLELCQLRSVSNYGFYDDPVRMLRIVRYRARFHYAIDERTARQFENAREAKTENGISARQLAEELRQIARENDPLEVLKTLDSEGMLTLFSPALTGAKLNTVGFTKLARAVQLAPYGVDLAPDQLALFLTILGETLTPKERAAMTESMAFTPEEVSQWQKLPGRARKLEKELQSKSLQRPSNLYKLLIKSPGEQILYVFVHSSVRLVQDRLKNYVQKYLPMSFEVTDHDVEATGATPGTAQFRKKKETLIAAKLNSRPKKPPVEAPPEQVVAVARR